MRTIITTTGKSIYNHALNEYKKEHNGANGTPTDTQIWNYLQKNPEKASAEINSISKIAQKDDHFVFLCTDDPQVELCTKLLMRYMEEERGYNRYQMKELQLKFQSDAHQIETLGIRNLVNTIIQEVISAQSKGQGVIINATAGFKAQVVYSTMIGMIYQVPVVYMYETFNKLVTFTPMAIAWDTNLFLLHSDFFQWITNDFRTLQEVESYLLTFDEDDRGKIRSMIAPDHEDYVFLTPEGDAFWQLYKKQEELSQTIAEPPPAKETNPAKKISSSINGLKHHNTAAIKKVCEEIAEFSWVEEITGRNYEPTLRTAAKEARFDAVSKKVIVTALIKNSGNTSANIDIRTTARNEAERIFVFKRIQKVLEQL